MSGACLMTTPAYAPIPGAARVLADPGDWYSPQQR